MTGRQLLLPGNPIRIQRSRAKGWRMPDNTVYVGRPTKWGNPCKVGMYRNYSAADAVADFRLYIDRDFSVRSLENCFGKPPTIEDIRTHLRGKNVCCWCGLDQPCHGDVYLEIANREEDR